MAVRPVWGFVVIFALVVSGCAAIADTPGEGEEDLEAAAAELREVVHPIGTGPTAYDPLLDLADSAEIVLIGDGTHGTEEFYRERARITRRLIEEHGFQAVAIEGDWSDAERVNHFVQGRGDDVTAEAALAGFERFPVWMWRNEPVRDFVGWLRNYNRSIPASDRVGFYGLDVYGLYESLEAVRTGLETIDPAVNARVRKHYECFKEAGDTPESYGQAVGRDPDLSCTKATAAALEEVRELVRNSGANTETLFSLERHARVVHESEAIYRTMYQGMNTWNARDRHMAETVQALRVHLLRQGRPQKVVVWAHNSHVGDARATESGQRGELNIGQILRETWGSRVLLVGMTTHSGTVTAASQWGGPAETKRVRPALPESYAALFHETGLPEFVLITRGEHAVAPIRAPRLIRFIGVLYLPQTERVSHYVSARLSEQFDAMVYFDQTEAVAPLAPTSPALAQTRPLQNAPYE